MLEVYIHTGISYSSALQICYMLQSEMVFTSMWLGSCWLKLSYFIFWEIYQIGFWDLTKLVRINAAVNNC